MKFLITIVCFLIIAYVLFRSCYTYESFESPQTVVPKIIWSYWDNPDTVPKAVHLCKKSWEKYNPGYEIRLLHKSNYKEYVKIPDNIVNHPNFNDSNQRFSDLLRLCLLSEHGGIWCDSSILVKQSFDSWLFDNKNKELYAFTIEFGNHPTRPPVIESWFLAAPPRSPFVTLWRDEFFRIADFNSPADYVKELEQKGIDIRDWHGPVYLAIHVSAAKILQFNKYPLDKLQLWPTESGPFKYLVKNDWNSEKAVHDACSDKSLRYPFIKMRAPERNVLENGINGQLSEEKCHWLD
jgi:hypothetical protein